MRDLDLGRRVRSESHSRVCWEGELLPSGIELTAPAAAIESSSWWRTARLAVTRETRANTPVDRGATDPQGDAEVHGSRRADTLARAVAAGALSTADAVLRIRTQPYVDAGGFAKVDLHRRVRCGFPEVIFGQGKTAQQIEAILRALITHGQGGLVTRVEPAAA